MPAIDGARKQGSAVDGGLACPFPAQLRFQHCAVYFRGKRFFQSRLDKPESFFERDSESVDWL